MIEDLVIWAVKAVVVWGALIATAAIMSLAERKVSAWMQYRYGPNRVGPFGILQPLADGLKFILKEELVPAGANRFLFRLAPAISAMPAMLAVAVIPFGYTAVIAGREVPLSLADLDVGILYILALGGLAVYGVILGGWASNSKYSLLGALRASAQMISYELSLMLAILSIVLVSQSLNLRVIVEQQRAIGDWNVWTQPLAFVLFTIAMFAETNRHPFDFAECEPELVGGFHTEYSAMRFALYFLGEYCAMTIMAALNTTLFWGGPSVPFWPHAPWWLGICAFAVKTAFFLVLYIWVRWTLPRLRFDQLMRLGWQVLLPLALANVTLTGAWMAFH